MKNVAGAASIKFFTKGSFTIFKRAAVETIRRGYDRFVVVGGQAQTETRLLGYTPTTAYTTGMATATRYGNTATAVGSSTTTVTGGVRGAGSGAGIRPSG
jgi:hypothetical protein